MREVVDASGGRLKGVVGGGVLRENGRRRTRDLWSGCWSRGLLVGS